jgi:hypothetical protein
LYEQNWIRLVHCSLYFIPALWCYCLQPPLLHIIAFVSSQPCKSIDFADVPGIVRESGQRPTNFWRGWLLSAFLRLQILLTKYSDVFRAFLWNSCRCSPISILSVLYLVLIFFLPRYVGFRVQILHATSESTAGSTIQHDRLFCPAPLVRQVTASFNGLTRSAQQKFATSYSKIYLFTKINPILLAFHW